jgi:phosphoglycolate phosphatase-like HAD superfamily hydrolase
MFDFIFLDLDGPVLEGRERHYACYRDIIEKKGGRPLDLDTYWQLKRQKTSRDVILEKSQFKAEYSVFMDAWMSSIESPSYLKYDALKPDVPQQLQRLKNHTRQLYLVTMRHNRAELLKQLDGFGILSFFDSVVDCPPLRQNTKYEALKNLNFKKALVIGDTEEDVNTARHLGVPCIGISNGLRDPRSIDTEHIFPELCDIPDALLTRLGT